MSKSFPHPVLGNRDDIAGYVLTGKIDILLAPDKDYWTLVFSAATDNPTLLELIKSGKARYLAEVECRNSYFRESYTFEKNEFPVNIPATALRDSVDVRFFIISTADIKDYLPVGVHPEYTGLKFNILPGDVLAQGGTQSFPADPEFDPLASDASTFIKVDEGTADQEYMLVRPGNDIITILLPKREMQIFKEVGGSNSATNILHSAIVLPVLQEAIRAVQGGDHEMNQSLKTLMEVNNLLDAEPEIAAQIVLSKPVSRALAELKLRSD